MDFVTATDSTFKFENKSLETAISKFMTNLKKSVDFDSGSLFIFYDGIESLQEVVRTGDGIDFISSVRFPMGTGLSAWVAQQGQLIYLSDIHRGSRHGLNPIRSYLSLPIEINDRVVAVLNLSHLIPHAFGENILKTIQTMSKKIARKIYNNMYLNIGWNDETDFTY